MTAKHIIFAGRVQGVGFRFTAHRMAQRHALTGFVRNQRDGSVEMLAQGLAEDIEAAIADIKESFPGYITETRTQQTTVNPKYTDFRITF